MDFMKLYVTPIILASVMIFSINIRDALAVTVCGEPFWDVDLFPVNSGNPNPMKVTYPIPSTNGYSCETNETKRIYNNPIPQVNWKPQLMNRGTRTYDLTYRIVFMRMLNSNVPSSCVSNWDVLDNNSIKFPQVMEGFSPTYTATIQGGPGSQVFGPSKELNNTFPLQTSIGGVVPTGWYQIDVQPGCRWGSGPNDINWETSKSIGATFINAGCQVPGSPLNLSGVPQTDATGKHKIVLTWNPPTPPPGKSQADVSRYNIYKYNNSTGNYDILLGSVDGQTTTFTDDNSGIGLACSNPSLTPDPGLYSYKVGAVGCNSGTLSPAVNVTTPLCTPSPCTLTSTSSCANSNRGKKIQVVNPGVSPMQLSYWMSSYGWFTTQFPGTEVIFTPIPVFSTTTGDISYNDGVTSCNATGTIYPNSTVQFSLQESLNGCSDTSIVNGLSAKTVSYNDTLGLGLPNPPVSVYTDVLGQAIFEDIIIKNQNIASCSDISYEIKVNVDNFINYNVCNALCAPGSNNCWSRNGSYWVYRIPSISGASPQVTLPNLVFEQITASQKWVSVSQGNLVVSGADIALQGTASDKLVENSGSVYSAGDIDLGNGSIGGNAPYNAYKIESYVNTDSNKFIDLVLAITSGSAPQIDFISSMSGQSKCEDFSSSSTKKVVFANNCDIEIKNGPYSGTNLPSNYELVIVKGGSLTIKQNVDAINASVIVENDIVLESTPSTSVLSVNGFMWTKQNLLLGRVLDIDTGLEYLDNDVLLDLVTSEKVYSLQFD